MPPFNQLHCVSLSYLGRPRISLGVPTFLVMFLGVICWSPFSEHIRKGLQPSVTQYRNIKDLTNWSGRVNPFSNWTELIREDVERVEIKGSATDPTLWSHLNDLPDLKFMKIVDPTPETFSNLVVLKRLETLVLTTEAPVSTNLQSEVPKEDFEIPSLKSLVNLHELQTIGFSIDRVIPAIEENEKLSLWICDAGEEEIQKQDLESLKEITQVRVLQLSPLSQEINSFDDLTPVLNLPRLELCFIGGSSIGWLQKMFSGWSWFRSSVIFERGNKQDERGDPPLRFFDLMIIYIAIIPLKIVFRHGWDCSLNELNWVIPKVSQAHEVVLYGLISLIAAAEVASCYYAGVYLLPSLAFVGFTCGLTAISFDTRFRWNRILTKILSKIVFPCLVVLMLLSSLKLDLGGLTQASLKEVGHQAWVFLVRFLSGNSPLISTAMILFGIVEVRLAVGSFGDLHRRTVELGWQDPTVLNSSFMEESQENREQADLEPDLISKFYRKRLLCKLIQFRLLESLSEKWEAYQLVAVGPIIKFPLGLLGLLASINWIGLIAGIPASQNQSNSSVIDFLGFLFFAAPLYFYGYKLHAFGHMGKRLASDLLLKPVSRSDINQRLILTAALNSLITLLFILPSALRIQFRDGEVLSISEGLMLFNSFVGMLFLATGLQIFSAVSQRSLKVRESWEGWLTSLIWLLVQALMLLTFAFSFAFDLADPTGGVMLLLLLASFAILAANILALHQSEFV